MMGPERSQPSSHPGSGACTVDFVLLLQVERKLASFDNIIVGLVQGGHTGESGTRNTSQRVE